MLINTSLQYLDSLASEPGADLALTAELASAYRKIANIQGDPVGANLGMLADSMANFEKGKKLFIALGDYKADDIGVQREFLGLSYSLARAYVQNGDARWQENIAATVKLAQRVATLKGAGLRDRGSAGLALAEQAHLTSYMIGQSPEVEASIEKAVSMLEQLFREFPEEFGAQDPLAATYLRAAEIYAGNRRTPLSLAHAIEMRGKAEALYSMLLATRPNEPRYKATLAVNQTGLADNLAQLGRYAEAEQSIQLALKQQSALAAADPENAYQRVMILQALDIAVRIAYRQGDQAKAIRHGHEAMSHFAAMPNDLQKMRDTRDSLSDAKAYLGLALMETAGKPGSSRDRQAAGLKEACALLADSVAFLEEARTAKLGVIDEGGARERTEGLARCQAKKAKLDMR